MGKKKFKFERDDVECRWNYPEYGYDEVLGHAMVDRMCMHGRNKKHECEEEYCPLVKSGQVKEA